MTNLPRNNSIKIVTVIGARPQFIKAATVTRVIERRSREGSGAGMIREVLVHTGQHYDHNMSSVFFDELGIPDPHHHLEVGSGSHAQMTGLMLTKVEQLLEEEKPDWVLVYGDTNSTLAGALAAAKLHIPVAHVEAGLRSYNRRMPEEINRVMTDHLSQLLFAPTATAVSNLAKEGLNQGVVNVGDVMLDAFLHHGGEAAVHSRVLEDHDLLPGRFILATVHRQENTDERSRLEGIFAALEAIAGSGIPVLLPLHPRTRKALETHRITVGANESIRLIPPVGYLDMICLESNARLILTDSGGVQKEAYFAGVPCVTLREETEWVETVEAGANFLAGAETERIVSAFERALEVNVGLKSGLYGKGHAASDIVGHLLSTSP